MLIWIKHIDLYSLISLYVVCFIVILRERLLINEIKLIIQAWQSLFLFVEDVKRDERSVIWAKIQ